MLEIGGVSLGIREGVIALIALVAVYMAFVIVRMRRLAARREAQRNVATAPPAPMAPAIPDPSHEPATESAVSEPEPADVPARPQVAAMPGAGAYRELESEVFQLRDEVDALRGEVAALREELKREMTSVRATQTVSPIYGDAMQMAVAGYDPAVIAERCGIARAEAELVVALAKSREE